MKKLLRRLFEWLFLNKKPIETKPQQEQPILNEKQELAQIEKEVRQLLKKVPDKPKKEYHAGMRNNRLHIEYSGQGREGRNSYIESFGKRGKPKRIMKAEAMYNGRIESMRCTGMERAQEIIRGIQLHCIKRATFKDKTGIEFKIA